MVSLDTQFVLDCAEGVRSALDRFERLRGAPEPLYLSVAVRAAVVAYAADRDEAFRKRVDCVLGATQGLDIDSESVRCAGEIALELAKDGQRLDGIDLFVAASARRYGLTVLSRNAGFGKVDGLVRLSY